MAEANGPASEGTSGRVLNPLWIISLFLGLAEVTVGVAATQAEGWIQGMLAVFSVVFPSAVAVAFFRTLLTRPFVLYAPRDYPDAPSIEAYVTAVSSAAGRNLENVGSAVRLALEEVVVPRLPAADQERTEDLIEEAVQAAVGDFQRRSVEVDLSGIDPSMEVAVLTFPLDMVTVSHVLDTVYLTISDLVDAYTYGSQWILVDPTTGRRLTDIGSASLSPAGIPREDNRSLREIGVRPGSRLLAKRM
ncbi:hypothetical protein AB0L75_29695 [Streptomyces sp. NPDC052101]|uniref:hypothetical protein n=1 Tax=Streptomyces sp. NPDC052101 TaxID=3155763 RepID=UPI00342F8481